MQNDSETVAKAFAILVILIVTMTATIWDAYDRAQQNAYRAFRDGHAQVIEYTVPGSGKCRAVLIDGERKAEACE